jgi:broad specificity phosphatase PhoE
MPLCQESLALTKLETENLDAFPSPEQLWARYRAYVSGWGEDGALDAVTEFAETIDQVARRIEDVLLAADQQEPATSLAA